LKKVVGRHTFSAQPYENDDSVDRGADSSESVTARSVVRPWHHAQVTPSASSSPSWTLVHPDHEAVAYELRRRFTTSTLEIGFVVNEHWFGFVGGLHHNLGPSLILTVNDPGLVPAALTEARRAVGDRDVKVFVEGHDRFHTLDDALRRHGCAPIKATTHLALVGDVRADRMPIGIEIRNVGVDGLEQWASTKIRCFDDSEVTPSAARLASEMAVRQSEMVLARLQLAFLDDEPVGVLAYYAGLDRLVFNLGTRVPFRHRGVAQALLLRWFEDGQREGCRSFLINANDPGQPAQLYRRMGFEDEVYWYQRYLWPAAPEDR
jgi:hypothetical protein